MREDLIVRLSRLSPEEQRQLLARLPDSWQLVVDLPHERTPQGQATELIALAERHARLEELAALLDRPLDRPPRAIRTPMEAIYVPYTQVRSPDFLLTAFFLWERIHLIRPEGLPRAPSRLERCIESLDPDFFHHVPFERHLDAAFHRYEILLGDETPPRDEIPVTIWTEKTTMTLRTFWEDRRVICQRRPDQLRIPRSWADLWVLVLADTIGESSGTPAVTDNAQASALIQRCRERAPLGQVTTALLRQGLDLPYAVCPPRLRGAERWVEARRRLRSWRERYLEAVSNWLDALPLDLTPEEPPEALASRLRRRFAEDLAVTWREELVPLGVASGIRRAAVSRPWLEGVLRVPALFEHHVRAALEE